MSFSLAQFTQQFTAALGNQVPHLACRPCPWKTCSDSEKFDYTFLWIIQQPYRSGMPNWPKDASSSITYSNFGKSISYRFSELTFRFWLMCVSGRASSRDRVTECEFWQCCKLCSRRTKAASVPQPVVSKLIQLHKKGFFYKTQG